MMIMSLTKITYQVMKWKTIHQNCKNEDTSDVESDTVPAKLCRPNEQTPEKNPKSQWRQKNPEIYSRNKRKTRRNLGQEYYSDSTKKKQRKFRQIGSPWRCTNMCRDKLQGTHEKIFNGIHLAPKKRSYRKKQKRQESSRKYNVIYKINVHSETVEICKTEFIIVYGLQSSSGKINLIVSR